MILDEKGRNFLLSLYPTATIHSIMNDVVIEKTVNEALRVPINVSCLSQNAYNACVSICRSIGAERFKESNLVKYINMTPNINSVTIQNDTAFFNVSKFVKAGIAYWILKLADDTVESLNRRREEIKLYFS